MLEIFGLNRQLTNKLAIADISDDPWAQPVAKAEKAFENIKTTFDSARKIEQLTQEIKEAEKQKNQLNAVRRELAARRF